MSSDAAASVQVAAVSLAVAAVAVDAAPASVPASDAAVAQQALLFNAWSNTASAGHDQPPLAFVPATGGAMEVVVDGAGLLGEAANGAGASATSMTPALAAG